MRTMPRRAPRSVARYSIGDAIMAVLPPLRQSPDATRAIARGRGRLADRQDLAGVSGMNVSNAEPLGVWADRMIYQAHERARREGDEFHRGPYPSDMATVTRSRYPDRFPFSRPAR